MTDLPFGVVAVGAKGITESSSCIKESHVMWSLHRIQIGYGKFSRAKLLAITSIGEATPVVTRAKLKARTPEVLNLFGTVHAQIEVHNTEDCSLDQILGKVLTLFHDDRIESELTLNSLKNEYDASLRLALMKMRHQRIKLKLKTMLAFQVPRPILDPEEHVEISAAAATGEPEPKEVENLSVPQEKADVTLDDAMHALALSNGRFNWVIIEPTKLALHNAGTGGLEELKDWLEEDKIMFCAFRFSGKDTVKYIFLHWMGPNTSVVKAGQWNSKVSKAEDLARKYFTISHKIKANSMDDLDLGKIIAEMKRLMYGLEDSFGNVVSGHSHTLTRKLTKEYGQQVQKDVECAKAHTEGKNTNEPEIEGKNTNVVELEGTNTIELEPDVNKEILDDLFDEEDDEPPLQQLPTIEKAVATVIRLGGEWNWVWLAAGGADALGRKG